MPLSTIATHFRHCNCNQDGALRSLYNLLRCVRRLEKSTGFDCEVVWRLSLCFKKKHCLTTFWLLDHFYWQRLDLKHTLYSKVDKKKYNPTNTSSVKINHKKEMSLSSINPYVQEWLQTLSLKSFLCQHAQKGLLNLVCGFESIKMQGGGHICVPVIGPSFFSFFLQLSAGALLWRWAMTGSWFSCWYFDSGMDRKQLLSFHFKNLCCLKWLQQQGN